MVQSSISRKCPGEPRRCLFSNPEPGDDTGVMTFFGLISLPWKQVALAWQSSYVAPKCQMKSGYVALEVAC